MSVKASNWVFDLSLKPAIKLVLLALADQSDDEGVSWPSMNTIAKKASCSVNTARRHIRQLEKMQLVESELRERHNGSYSSNRYKIFIGREPINPDDSPDSGPDSDDDQNSDYLPETPNDEAPTNLGGAKSSPPNFGGGPHRG
ncbi:helix-turn-helix domain-containing protein [Zooshikella ganghwensis]|uniref:Helix-turn-helix domain-containing protein n=1 Tax=Zooshikella ganghwensis TaxID=202772 RepID=A0A4P9VH44_9GAMM|nr:helix-turn-helix domain-containing protein [Zooshikella ganghwensis]RDH41709.1 helix-turn-helix domain-containing protein [Zooshikella ganghwensis]